MKILFICGDNVGRSQAAEAMFNAYARGSKAESCAGKPIWKAKKRLADITEAEAVISIMKSDYGIDLSEKFSKPFDQSMVDSADIVVTLCDESECPRIDGARHWDIPKLSRLDMEGKRSAIMGLEARVRELISSIDDRA